MTEGRSAGGEAVFSLLGERLRSALSERGFRTPTLPQQRALPPLVEGRNTLVVAPTGTGKTETAMLPVFDSLVSDRPEGIGALYVTPLRALNRDMRERLEWWGEQLDLRVDVRHGDTTDYRRRRQAVDPPDVLITTPETVQAMLTGERLREGLSSVDHVIVDEVHELAGDKRGAQLTVGLERLRRLAGPFQRIGLSATVGDPGEVGRFLTGDRGCSIVEVDATSRLSLSVVSPETTGEDEHLAAELAVEPKTASHVRTIRDLVADSESALIFVNTRQTAEALGSRFRALDESIGVHHGSLSKEARIEVEDEFKAGRLDGLLCTSSMELGIDVGRVDHVIQYRSPREVTRLLQRVGRAGHRSDRISRGTVVAADADDVLESIVIARRGLAGSVEPAAIHHGSLDVVANQVAGIVHATGGLSAREVYETITAAYPFRNLDEETFREVVRELSRNRIVWIDEESDRLETSGATWQYVYATLSMIPDEETYEVRDVAAGRNVGTLDERFVVNFAQPGATFVQRGRMWRISTIEDDENRVEVTPVEDPAGEVPSWTGEEIPVPEAVAREVGELRRIAAEQVADGAPIDAVARDLAARYPADADVLETGIATVGETVDAGLPVPTDERVVVEAAGGTVVVNAALGHEANETVGRICTALVGQQTGSSIGLDIDPYRIELSVPPAVSGTDVAEVLRETDPAHVRPIVELTLKRSNALRFRLAHVAATFGALRGWEGASARDLSSNRLLAALEDTPIYDEAVREVFHEDLDADAAADAIARIQSRALDLTVIGERTPVGLGGRTGGGELIAPEVADASVIESVKERLLDDEVRLLCVHCTEWERRRRVGSLPDEIVCPNCESTRIAALNPWDEETPAAVRAREKDTEQERLTRRAHRSANLVQAHGQKAIVALAARGIGPDSAARVLGKLRESELELYRDILEREREYARTKAFWD